MLPSHVRSSQSFHESVSSFWSLPKLPCEGVRTAICGPPPEPGAEVTPNNLPVFSLAQFGHFYNFTLGFLGNSVCCFSFFSLEASFFITHLDFLFFHLEFLYLEYIWGFPSLFYF